MTQSGGLVFFLPLLWSLIFSGSFISFFFVPVFICCFGNFFNAFEYLYVLQHAETRFSRMFNIYIFVYVCTYACIYTYEWYAYNRGIPSYTNRYILLVWKKKLVHAPDMHMIAFRNDWCALNSFFFFLQKKQSNVSMESEISLWTWTKGEQQCLKGKTIIKYNT